MKRKILFINNYDMKKSRESFLRNESPGQHLFGTNELIDTNEYEVDYELIKPKKHALKIAKLLSIIPAWIKIYFKARHYDIVYGGADFTVDFLGIMKQLKLFRPQLIAIFHHPPFEKRIKYAKYDKLIFLGEKAHQEMQQAFPKIANKMFFIQWGPDLQFYNRFAPTPNYEINHEELVFISNGKTKRNHELFIDALEKAKAKGIIVCDYQSFPKNYSEDCQYIELYIQEHHNDVNMVKLLNKCAVLVIPTHATERLLGPIGLTSFLDAAAMGIPIITATNTVFADLVAKHELGLTYHADNLGELKRAIDTFKQHPELVKIYGKNMANFGKTHTIKDFGKTLYQIINNKI